MSMITKIEKGINGVTAAQGFLASGIHSGIKRQKKDIAVIYSSSPAECASVFTKNKVVAAPLVVDKIQLEKGGPICAIIVNSGNANACTGERGLSDAWEMVACAAAALSIDKSQVLVSSTGVIGQYLPMEKVIPGIKAAAGSINRQGHFDAAEAILTTDTFAKEYAVQVDIGGKIVTVGGISKGSGMIAPNMATMLAFITTDAAATKDCIQKIVKTAADRSFNRISVDGDMSTNDMAVVMANGLAGNRLIEDSTSSDYETLYTAIEHVMIELSKMIVLDGEGATKFLEITVTGAKSEEEADKAARSVANSSLVKTAFNGEDANWGRILAAVGYSGIDFNPDKVEIYFGDLPILRKGYDIDFSEEEAKKILVEKHIVVTISLNQGSSSATFWTCDLSKEYVAINANYRT